MNNVNPKQIGASPPRRKAPPRHEPSTSEYPSHRDSSSASHRCWQTAAPIFPPRQKVRAPRAQRPSLSSSNPVPLHSADSPLAAHRKAPASPRPIQAALDTPSPAQTTMHPRLPLPRSTAAAARYRPAPRTTAQTWQSPNHRHGSPNPAPKSPANSTAAAASYRHHQTKRKRLFPCTRKSIPQLSDLRARNSKSFLREFRSKRAASSSQNPSCDKHKAANHPTGAGPRPQTLFHPQSARPPCA